ncbi:MAG: acyltransferase [Chitinophagaceae bacterium]|nr:acyltransferase [Chitinophagaceae bacterium]
MDAVQPSGSITLLKNAIIYIKDLYINARHNRQKEKGKDHLLLDPVGIPVKTVSQKLYLVQLLGGIASLLVLLKHTTVLVKVKWGASFWRGSFCFWRLRVDIFFVLSGFIITYTSMKALNNPSNFVGFLRRRFIRIFIVYWIITSIFLLLQQLLPSFFNNLYEYSIFNVLSTYLLLPEHTMVNGVSWSLSNEVFFYFLFLALSSGKAIIMDIVCCIPVAIDHTAFIRF